MATNFSPTGNEYLPDLVEDVEGRPVRLPRVLGPSESPGEAGGMLLGPGTGDNMAAALGVGAGPGDVVVSIGTSGTVFASGEEGGVSRANVDAITSDVRAMRARPDVDRVVVTLHMGTEYTHVVTPRQQELARAAIEAGADLVVAHHPHVLQPVEEYRARVRAHG